MADNATNYAIGKDQKLCVNCKQTCTDNKHYELFDELCIELKVSELLSKYFKIDLDVNTTKCPVLCEECLDQLITAFDVDEYNKQKTESSKIKLSTKDEPSKTEAKLSDKEIQISSLEFIDINPKTNESKNGPVLVSDIAICKSNPEIKVNSIVEDDIEQTKPGISSHKTGLIEFQSKISSVIIVQKDCSVFNVVAGQEDLNSEGHDYEEITYQNDSSSEYVAPDVGSQNIADDSEIEECDIIEASNIEVIDEVELFNLLPISTELDQINVEAYLNEAINTDFTTLKFNWNTVCNICSLKCKSFEQLLSHIRERHGLANNFFPCSIDNCEPLEGEKMLARHIVIKHSPLDKLQIYGSCPDCALTFSSFHIFNKHSCARMIKRRRGMRLYCEMCGIDFVSMKRFVFHMQYHLEKRRPRMCFICNYENSNIEELFEHVYYDHEPENTFACRLCDRIFKDEQKLIDHNHAGSGEYECGDCKKSFLSKARLLAHVKATHTQPVICHTCGEYFINESKYRLHQKWHSNMETEMYACSNCGLVSVDQEKYVEHVSLLDTECFGADIESVMLSVAYTCEFCSLDFKNKDDLKLHRSSGIHQDGQYVCLPCKRTFSTMKLYRTHKKHKLPAIKKANICYFYMCNVDNCEESYAQWNSLYTHKRRNHDSSKITEAEAEDDEDQVDQKEPNKIIYTCQFCNKVCPTKMSLSVHIARRHNNKNVICSFCNASFKDKAGLKKHEDYMHVPIECVDCFKVVKNRRNYEVHQRVVHMAEKRYFCKVCDKGFYHKSDKEAHEKLHDETYACKECPFITNYVKSLDIHVASMHRLEYDFECSICNRKFARKQALNMHIKRHSHNKQFVCFKHCSSGCSKSFTTKSQLRKHIKQVHQDIDSPDTSDSGKKNVTVLNMSLTEAADGDVECEVFEEASFDEDCIEMVDQVESKENSIRTTSNDIEDNDKEVIFHEEEEDYEYVLLKDDDA